MKKQRFNEHQIIGILKAVESGRLVKDVCREYGVGKSTYFKWKSKYGGMEASDICKYRWNNAPHKSGVDLKNIGIKVHHFS